MKTLIILFNIVISTAYAGGCYYEDKMEYENDTRVSSVDYRIARLRHLPHKNKSLKTGAGTAFLISKSCLLTAAHNLKKQKIVEFEVKPSKIESDSPYTPSDPENIYKIKDKKIRYKNGSDWAVIRVKPNIHTNLYPGEKYGFFQISTEKPQVSDHISLSGYGGESSPLKQFQETSKHVTLQQSEGQIKNIKQYPKHGILFYNAFSERGNSGAPVIKNDKVIGIHYSGICKKDSTGQYVQSNSAMMIYKNKKLLNAIKECIIKEKSERN